MKKFIVFSILFFSQQSFPQFVCSELFNTNPLAEAELDLIIRELFNLKIQTYTLEGSDSRMAHNLLERKIDILSQHIPRSVILQRLKRLNPGQLEVELSEQNKREADAKTQQLIDKNNVVLEYLVEKGMDLEGRNINGENIIHIAVSENRQDMIGPLVKAGADIEAKDTDGLTPLITAASIEQIEALRELIKHKANVDAQDKDLKTALHWAGRDGLGEVVKVLLKAKADYTLEDKYHKTPLDEAEKADNKSAARALRNAIKSAKAKAKITQ